MEISPYSIYVEHRPFRIAFLISPADNQNWIDKIIEYNRSKWGGQYNPIIFTDGKSIQENWWNFLRKYDPDIIVSTLALDDELLKQIHIFLSPLKLEILKQDSHHIHLSEEPISIRPNIKNISALRKGSFIDETSFVIFEVVRETPDIIKRFLKINFGSFNSSEINYLFLKDPRKKIYTIKDSNSLNAALNDLGTSYINVVFPNQICTLPNTLKKIESLEDATFQVIIGDGNDSITHFWNRTIFLSNWSFIRPFQICVPKELIENNEINQGLSKFISHYAVIPGKNYNCVNFISFSSTKEQLEIITNTFKKTIPYSLSSICFNAPQIPSFRDEWSFFFLKRDLELYRAHSETEYLVLPEPEVELCGLAGEHWFADLYIQFKPERFKSYSGKEFWWQLPKRQLKLYPFFNKPVRINKYNSFSVLIGRKTDVNNDANTLIIKIPYRDESIFYDFICGESYSCISSDPKDRSSSIPYNYFQSSDKGMYLSGILSLFPDLFQASHWLQKRLWRNIFDKLSNKNRQSEEKEKETVRNTLKKHIANGYDFTKSENLNWITEKVFILAKNYSKKDVEIRIDDFLNEQKKEFSDYSKLELTKIELTEEHKNILKDDISDLIDMNILFVGIKPRCPHCGYRFWYLIDEAKQHIICKGCGFNFALSSSENWYFKLNTLVSTAFSEHGVIPVLITLGQLLSDSRTSFIFIPNINLYKSSIVDKLPPNDGELDIICIQDGKFIIGEVKQSIGLFRDSDFKKMKEIALLLKPDKVIFSSLNKASEVTDFVKDKISELQNELSHLEIIVEWYQIYEYVFDPSPS